METIFDDLARFIDSRYEGNTKLDLFDDSMLADFVAPPERDLVVLQSEARAASDALGSETVRRKLSKLMTERTARAICARNQFVSLHAREMRRLIQTYEELVERSRVLLSSGPSFGLLHLGAVDLLKSHFISLQEFVQSLGDAELLQAGVRVPCSEYNPSTQLDVLGIEVQVLREPVLDLGCGEMGALVGHLRELGIEAYGVDRFATASRFLSRADWMRFPSGGSRWGTIISHMSFSNHFRHHHMRRGGEHEGYARRYMELLGALAPGGSFHYAPGLPFIEGFLPRDRFEVELKRVSAPSCSSPEVLYRDIAPPPLCSARVKRLPLD